MLKKTIKYTDHDGNEIIEDFYFNLTKTDILQKQLKTPGGYGEKLAAMYKKKDIPAIMENMEEFIKDSYGIKSADGKHHYKTAEAWNDFRSSPAFDELYFELMTDADKAAAFIKGIMPSDLKITPEMEEEAKKQFGIEQ